jgi:hypothetical protein
VNRITIKALGIAAAIVGMGATLLSDWVDEKKTEKIIDEKVNEALAKREKDEEES